MNIGPMLNAYPDSMGGTLDDIAAFLQKPEMKDVFSSSLCTAKSVPYRLRQRVFCDRLFFE